VLEAAKAADLTVTRPTRTAIRPSLVGKLVRIPRAAFGLAVLTIVLFCAVFAHWIVPFDPEEMDFDALLEGVSAVHLLGSDQLVPRHSDFDWLQSATPARRSGFRSIRQTVKITVTRY
jgi:hypothetical protein